MTANADPIDLRAVVTRSELDAFHADPQADAWQFAFWDNSRLEPHRNWSVPDSTEFDLLTREQKFLALAMIADGQISNGGISQLFFNNGGSVPSMEEALLEMGCKRAATILTAELERLSAAGYIESWTKARQGFSRGLSEGEKEVAWKAFNDLNDRYFGDESGELNEAWYAAQGETFACIKAYVKDHEKGFFLVKAG